MKPNADMITKILHNLRVNGRFNQDKLIIGRGQDEQLQLMISDTVGIRYTPGVTGERTFSLQITTPDTHPVWGTAVTLYPHPKPSNSYTNRTVLASSTMVWISEPLPDFPTTVFAMMVTTDNTENVAPAMAQRWSLRSLDYNETNQDVDWENSSETILVCGNDTITWSGDEASMYPSSPNDWNTTGSVGSQPVAFNMNATEGSAAKLEYTNDGSTWYEFGGTSSVDLTYEPIEFDQSHLSSDGKITIQHNFSDKNVLCLGYTPQPKEIEYLDNQIVLDYSDQNSANLSGAVWFIGSQQSMLSGGTSDDPSTGDPVYVISGAGTTDVNGSYWAVPTEEWSNIFNGTTLNNMQHCWTNGTYYLCDILSQYPYPSRTIQIMGYEYVDGVASSNMVNFYTCAPFSLDGDITTATFQVAHGDSPAPTITLA